MADKEDKTEAWGAPIQLPLHQYQLHSAGTPQAEPVEPVGSVQLTCPSCQSRFRVDIAALEPTGSMVRCSRCRHVWQVMRPGSEPAEDRPAEASEPTLEQVTRALESRDPEVAADPDPEPAVSDAARRPLPQARRRSGRVGLILVSFVAIVFAMGFLFGQNLGLFKEEQDRLVVTGQIPAEEPADLRVTGAERSDEIDESPQTAAVPPVDVPDRPVLAATQEMAASENQAPTEQSGAPADEPQMGQPPETATLALDDRESAEPASVSPGRAQTDAPDPNDPAGDAPAASETETPETAISEVGTPKPGISEVGTPEPAASETEAPGTETPETATTESATLESSTEAADDPAPSDSTLEQVSQAPRLASTPPVEEQAATAGPGAEQVDSASAETPDTTASIQASVAEHVLVRAGRHESFGRIVFDWPQDVTYETRLDGGRLLVSFSRSAVFDTTAVTEHLSDYVGRPEISRDLASISFPLTDEFEVETFMYGLKVVIDLKTPSGD